MEVLVHCFYTLPLRDCTTLKLLLNLKKHALQDDTKVLAWSLMDDVQHLLQEKAKQMLWSVSFGVITPELRKLCTLLNSGVLLFDTRHSWDLST